MTATRRAESAHTATAPVPSVPNTYWWWLGGITLSLLGSQTQAFALGWTATATSGALAGIVLSAFTIPNLVLVLIGGAVSDQSGPWRVMVTSDAAMLIVTVALAVGVALIGTPPWLLVVTAALVGAAAAFYSPASGVLPRLLVDESALGRAMAARQTSGQLANSLGPPLGGVIVTALGLGVAALVNAATFAIMLVLLVTLRRKMCTQTPPATGGGLLARAAEGLIVCWRDSLLRPLLLLTLVAAAVLLPVTSILVPLLVRAHGWNAVAAGQIVGAQALGSGLAVLVILWRNTSRSPGIASSAGLCLAGISTASLAATPTTLSASIAGFSAGVGIGIFGAHVGPLLLGAAPHSHLARVQAVLALVQALPLLVTLNLVGAIADRAGPTVVIASSGILTLIAGLAGITHRSVRTASIKRMRITTPNPSSDSDCVASTLNTHPHLPSSRRLAHRD